MKLPLMRVHRIRCPYLGATVPLDFCKRHCRLYESVICPRRPSFEEWWVHELTGRWRRLG